MKPSLSVQARLLLEEIESQEREARLRQRENFTPDPDVVRERKLRVIEDALRSAAGVR